MKNRLLMSSLLTFALTASYINANQIPEDNVFVSLSEEQSVSSKPSNTLQKIDHILLEMSQQELVELILNYKQELTKQQKATQDLYKELIKKLSTNMQQNITVMQPSTTLGDSTVRVKDLFRDSLTVLATTLVLRNCSFNTTLYTQWALAIVSALNLLPVYKSPLFGFTASTLGWLVPSSGACALQGAQASLAVLKDNIVGNIKDIF